LLVRTDRLFQIVETALRTLFGAPESDLSNFSVLATKITVSQIRSLIAVSENASFEQAARFLEVSQPTVQRAARDLEKLLRRSLFRRAAGGVTTTAEGIELARRMKLALQELDYGKDEINAKKGIVRSLINIGTLASSGSILITRALHELLKRYPQIKVRIVEQPYERLLSDLRTGEIDFLLSVLRKPAWAVDLAEKELFRDRYVVAVRREHPLLRKRSVNREDLRAYDWILPGRSTPRYLAFRRLFPSEQESPTIRVETASRSILRNLLAVSNQVTLLTQQEIRFEEAFGVLSALPFDPKVPQHIYGVATRVEWQPTPAQSEFLTLLSALGKEFGKSRGGAVGIDEFSFS
jgi:DNA-binding transcriptional LysR family regulator